MGCWPQLGLICMQLACMCAACRATFVPASVQVILSKCLQLASEQVLWYHVPVYGCRPFQSSFWRLVRF